MSWSFHGGPSNIYKLTILDWKRQHERFKHDFARLKTKKNHNCMMCRVKASSMFSSPCKSEWLPFGSCALALKVLRPFQRSTLGFNSSHRYLRRHHPQIFAGFKFEIGPRANESTKLLVPTHQKHEWIDVRMTKSLSHHRKLRCRCSWRPLPKFQDIRTWKLYMNLQYPRIGTAKVVGIAWITQHGPVCFSLNSLLRYLRHTLKTRTSWWFQPVWKILVKFYHFFPK